MYTLNMNRRLYRSPEAGEGGGAGPAAGATGGDTGGSAGAAGESAATPQYLTKDDFESRFSRLENHIRTLTPAQQARQESKDGTKEHKFPSLSDYRLDQGSQDDRIREYERFERDKNAFFRSENKRIDKEENDKTAAEERASKTERGHYKRVSEYKKDHPEFDSDMKKAGSLNVEDSVKSAVYASSDSAAVVHHISKNSALLDELNELALTGRSDEIPYMVGKIAARIESETKLAGANAEAADVKPPRQNFRNIAPGKDKIKSNAERFDDYNA